MPSRCRGNMSHDQDTRRVSKSDCDKSDCDTGACEPFKRLGTVSDYTELLDAVGKFRTWKETVLKPIVNDLGSSLRTLKETNRVLHELAEFVTTSLSTSDIDELVCTIESQLRTLGVHMNVLRNAPSKLLKFKEKTFQRMMTLKNKYAATMRQMHEVVGSNHPRCNTSHPNNGPFRQLLPIPPSRRPQRIPNYFDIRRTLPRHYSTPSSRPRVAARILKKKRRKHRTKSHKKRKRHHKHKK